MKYIRKIHLWLSVPFGIIITLTCFSGAMLVFEPEITRALQKQIYYVASSEGEPRPIEELMKTVKATLPDSVSITGVTVFADKERTYQVGLSKPRRAAIFIDQYSGKITGRYERLGFFSTMFKLHRWLLDSANPHGEGIKAGKLLVGISTIMFVIALITGAVMWWQRTRKSVRGHAPSPAEQQPANPALPQHGPRGGFWRSLAISWRNGWPAFWKSLHVAGGMYVIIFLLAMALTGLTWSFQWYRTAFYAVCGVEHTPRNAKPAPSGEKAEERGYHGEGRGHGEGHRHGRHGEGRDYHGEKADERGYHGEEVRHGEGQRHERHGEGRGYHGEEAWQGEGRGHGEEHRHRRHSEFRHWQEVFDELKSRYPSAPQITVSPEAASVTLGTAGNARAADEYAFNRRSGELSPAVMYTEAKPADKLRGWIYAVHTGAWGGLPTRLLWLIATLLGATLPLTGYYIWIRHLLKRRNAAKTAH